MKVEAVSPARDAVVPADQPLGAVMVSFSHPVRFDTLTPDTLQVMSHTETQPYPFEANPRLVSRVTFVPDDPTALQPATLKSGETRARVVTVNVAGVGDKAVLDAAGRPIDADGSGAASDLTSTFTVGTPRTA